MAEFTEMKVRLIDVEGIHGLIESLTTVAECAVKVVEVYDGETGDLDFALENPMETLRDAILGLNDYVDKHLHDE